MTQPTNPNSNPESQTPSIQEQIDSGIDLQDLNLPSIPQNRVVEWDEGNPLEILQHEALSEYVFRWLNPKMRERNSMEGWQFVSGDLAKAVRRCGIIQALVGGDSNDEMIRNGDLILGWMPREWMEKRKEHYRRINARVRESVEQQQVAETAMKKGSGSRYISKEGRVSSYRGPLSRG